MRELSGIASLIPSFDTFAIDQWGVIHDGRGVYPGVAEAMVAVKAADRHVMIITNSSKSSRRNIARLADRFDIHQGRHYDSLISSAELLRDDLVRRAIGTPTRIHSVCAPEDADFFSGVAGIDEVTIDAAECVVLLSVPTESIDIMVPRIQSHVRKVLVPSSDMSSVTIEGLASGLAPWVAALEARGVQVSNYGKPSASFYEYCASQLPDPHGKTLAIGDQVPTDVVGAARAGWESALVLTGAGTVSRELPGFPSADYILPSLRL